MARIARHLSGPGALCPGTLYHITTRGVDRVDIFHSSLDRLVFFALLADVCLDLGLVVHAFCLMDNHLHLLVEDSRGMVSHAFQRLLSSYAQFFNVTRPVRRSGHLFADRFFSEVVDSRLYYDRLAAYILTNPLRTLTPLASSVEAYPWSSAKLTLAASPIDVWRRQMASFGGVDAMMAMLPRSRSTKTRRNRARRFERLVTGDWFDAEAVRCGRSVEEYRKYLDSQTGHPRPVAEDLEQSEVETTAKARAGRTPRLVAKWEGVELAGRFDTIAQACGRWWAGANKRAFGDLVSYALHRFSNAPVSRMAHALGRVSEGFQEAVRRVRALRANDRGWASLLWSIEWTLRWQLRAGPWRE